MICPCKECVRRSPACHDICYDYISWSKINKNKKALIREARQKDSILNAAMFKSAERKRKAKK